jgi:hypothetical protein
MSPHPAPPETNILEFNQANSENEALKGLLDVKDS